MPDFTNRNMDVVRKCLAIGALVSECQPHHYRSSASERRMKTLLNDLVGSEAMLEAYASIARDDVARLVAVQFEAARAAFSRVVFETVGTDDPRSEDLRAMAAAFVKFGENCLSGAIGQTWNYSPNDSSPAFEELLTEGTVTADHSHHKGDRFFS